MEHPATSGLNNKTMADNPINNKQLAVKAENDDALAKMETEVAEALANPNPEDQGTPPATGEETVTPAPTSAEGETKPVSETPKPEDAKPETTPDGEKPKADASKDDEFTDDDVKHLSEKAQKRFKQMNAELRRLKAQELSRNLGPKQQPVSDKRESLAKPSALPWDRKPAADGPKEVTDEEYQADVQAKAQEAARTVIRNEKIVNGVIEDRKYLEENHPELNQESEQFDPVLAEYIATTFKSLFKDNNDLRLKDYAEQVLSLRAKGVEQGKSEVTATVVKQAAEQAMSPSTTRVMPKTAADAIAGAKSMEELEAAEKLLTSSQ